MDWFVEIGQLYDVPKEDEEIAIAMSEQEKAQKFRIKCFFVRLKVRCKDCQQWMTFVGPRVDKVNDLTGFAKEWPFNPIQPCVSPDGYTMIVPIGEDRNITTCSDCGTFRFKDELGLLPPGMKHDHS